MELEFPCTGEFAELVRESDPDAAISDVFRLSEDQAKEVLALRLARLTALDQDVIVQEAKTTLEEIKVCQRILNNPSELDDIIRAEMLEIKSKFAGPRRTVIQSSGPDDIDESELVENKPVVITLTHKAYIKYTLRDAYREQRRGGSGKSGMDTKEDDFVVRTLVTTARTPLLFITTRGIAHIIRAHKLPEAPPNGRGRPLVNCLPMLAPDEGIAAILPIPASESEADGMYMIFVTDRGDVRRNAAGDFMSVNRAGKIAMKLVDADGNPTGSLIDVLMCDGESDVVIATRKGKAVRFPVDEVRVFNSRTSTGVTGVKLGEGDAVIGAAILKHSDASPQDREAYFAGGTYRYKDDAGADQEHVLAPQMMEEMKGTEQFLLTVSAQGYGKRFSSHEFRVSGRAVQGVASGKFSEQTGDQVACLPVEETDGLILVTDGGQVIRTRVSEIRRASRDTRGVTLFEVPVGDRISAVARVPAEE
jgi:DNA gyrase subunit A